MNAPQPRPALMLGGDHLVTIRHAVSEVQEDLGLLEMARRTRCGELDGQPIMQAAIRAVERVLKGMFE